MGAREKISLTLPLDFNSLSVTAVSKPRLRRPPETTSTKSTADGPEMQQSMDIQRLLDLRKITQAISRKFEADLKAHLATLAPLFSPLPLFGEYARGGAKSSGLQAEKAYRELRSRFQSIAEQRPFSLNTPLASQLDLFAATPVPSPLEYTYTARTEQGEHSITVTSPLRWVLSYPETDPRRIRELLADDRNLVKEELAHALLQCLAMEILLEQRPGLVKLLRDLRYQVQSVELDGLGSLPTLTISSPIATQRPPDEIIIQNTQLTGIPSFEEVIEVEQIRRLEDPVRQELLGITQSLSPAIHREILA